jgi:hypothetical protein
MPTRRCIAAAEAPAGRLLGGVDCGRGANVFRLPPNPLMLRWIGYGDG